MIVRCSRLLTYGRQQYFRKSLVCHVTSGTSSQSTSGSTILRLSTRGVKEAKENRKVEKEFEDLNKFNRHVSIWEKMKNEKKMPSGLIFCICAGFWIYVYCTFWLTRSVP